MTPTKEAPTKKMVPIARITEDHSLQVRGCINAAKVKEYEAILAEQDGVMDPIDLFYSDDTITPETVFAVADGFHRVGAYRALGIEKVPAKLHRGTHADALKFALLKNGHHGMQLSNAEKRSACEKAVVDPEVGQLSDKEIARMIGCSATLVGEARRGETKEQKAGKRKQAEEKKRAPQNAAPKPQADPPALREVTATERKPLELKATKPQILKQIQSWVDLDQVDEAEVVALFETGDGKYRFLPKDGGVTRLRVVGKSGREQSNIEVVVRGLEFDVLTLRYEGDGKVKVEE